MAIQPFSVGGLLEGVGVKIRKIVEVGGHRWQDGSVE